MFVRKDGGFRVWSQNEINEGQAPSCGVKFDQNGVKVHCSLIAYTYTSSSEVYFVCGDNGDEFGQFAELQQALERATEMAKFDEDERAVFDL
jgi:hypothetical protein